MTTWRIERPPDRWDLVQAILQEPAMRTDVEFFVRHRQRKRLIPARVLLHTLVHTHAGCLHLGGVLTAYADHAVRHQTVQCRIWPRIEAGEILSLRDV